MVSHDGCGLTPLSPPLPTPQSFGRAIGWARRSLSELRHLREDVREMRRDASSFLDASPAKLDASSAKAQLSRAVRTLADGISCVDRGIQLWNATHNPSAARGGGSGGGGSGGSGGGGVVGLGRNKVNQVLTTLGGSDTFPRSISLRSAACSTCRWASYVGASRYAKESTAAAHSVG